MDRISKTICVDNSRSHRNGLLPFVRFGGSGITEEVSSESTNGNYGQYVYDFTIYSGETEYARLRYLDIIRKYNFIQEQIRNGVFVKKYVISQDELTKLDCETNDSTTTLPVYLSIFITDFDERNTKLTYEFRPLDSQYFYEKNGYYVFEMPLQYTEIKDKNDDELTDDEKALKEKIDYIKSFTEPEIEPENSEKFFIILPNYDDVIKYNKEWGEWWNFNLGNEWHQIFNGHIAPPESYKGEFNFCYDVDSYILGRVEVVYDGNTGSKVPNYVYYTEIGDRIKWFEDNSGVTVSAYSNPSEETEWLIKQWEERGGGKFYDFLSGIAYTDKWQTNREVPINGRTFKYSPPLLNLEAIINAEIENEYLFTPYEYSIVNNLKENAVCEYSATSISNLKPQFITYDSAHTVKVESQLQTLTDPMAIQVNRDIFGSFEYFDESGITGQMFECTYCSGRSETPHIVCYHSGKTVVYQFNESGEKIGQYEVLSGKTYVDEKSEKCPKPFKSNAYICYATKVKEEFVEVSNTDIKENKNESGETYNCYWSALTTSTYEWWECESASTEGLICADGEDVKSKEKKYRNVTILSCIDSLVGKKNIGDKYYVLARFNNGNEGPETICSRGKIHSLKIPYIEGKELNIVSYEDGTEVYDKVVSGTPKEDQGVVEIEYVKGVTRGLEDSTGVHYKDTINYTSNNFGIVPIDGVYPAELYYNTLDFEKSKETVFSNEYILNRKVLRSEIIGMEVGTQWTSEGAVSALLFTKDGAEGLQEEPKYNINMLYNRGNAAAWENHFKLSECNTMEDLENYGNNFFNL